MEINYETINITDTIERPNADQMRDQLIADFYLPMAAVQFRTMFGEEWITTAIFDSTVDACEFRSMLEQRDADREHRVLSLSY